jgi:hypothetical protein
MRESKRRRDRGRSMKLWQIDVTSRVHLATGQEVNVVTDIDDRSPPAMRGDRAGRERGAPEHIARHRPPALCWRSQPSFGPAAPPPPRRGRTSRSAGRVADPGVAQGAALAILHTQAGSLGDRMRTPASFHYAPRQLMAPPFVPRIDQRHQRSHRTDSSQKNGLRDSQSRRTNPGRPVCQDHGGCRCTPSTSPRSSTPAAWQLAAGPTSAAASSFAWDGCV